MKYQNILLTCCIVILTTIPCFAQDDLKDAETKPYKATPIGSTASAANPEISLIVDIQALFTDNEDIENNKDVNINEVELAFQGYLYPNIHGDFIAAMHEHDGEWKVHPEEAYISFYEMPFGLQAQVGRKLIDFGKLNSIHPHHWAFVSTPLVLQNFFGDHPWYDDGVQVSALIPNPANVYIKVYGEVWNGRELGHSHSGDAEETEHEHEGEETLEEHAHEHHHAVEWSGHVFTGGVRAGITTTENSNILLGYSIARDEDDTATLHAIDGTFIYRFPMSYRKFKVSGEYFLGDIEKHGTEPSGYYATAQMTLTKYWECGVRYDNSEFINDDENSIEAYSAFLTRYFSHSLYLRGEYQHLDAEPEEDKFTFQLVWGLGPHSHRLED